MELNVSTQMQIPLKKQNTWNWIFWHRCNAFKYIDTGAMHAQTGPRRTKACVTRTAGNNPGINLDTSATFSFIWKRITIDSFKMIQNPWVQNKLASSVINRDAKSGRPAKLYLCYSFQGSANFSSMHGTWTAALIEHCAVRSVLLTLWP